MKDLFTKFNDFSDSTKYTLLIWILSIFKRIDAIIDIDLQSIFNQRNSNNFIYLTETELYFNNINQHYFILDNRSLINKNNIRIIYKLILKIYSLDDEPVDNEYTDNEYTDNEYVRVLDLNDKQKFALSNLLRYSKADDINIDDLHFICDILD